MFAEIQFHIILRNKKRIKTQKAPGHFINNQVLFIKIYTGSASLPLHSSRGQTAHKLLGHTQKQDYHRQRTDQNTGKHHHVIGF